MPIDLPALPRLATVSPRLLTYGADLQPPLGGPTQRIRRLGSRFGVDVQLPPLTTTCAGQWLAALLRAEAEGDTLRLVIPQVAPTQAAANVNGGGQLGTQLAITPLSAAVPAGAMFSFTSGGHTYLHQATASAAAGSASLRLAPSLRAAPPQGAALNFAAPVLEGYAAPGPIAWELQLKRFATISFTLTENR